MNKVIFPGSFDPFHNGHLDIVKEALKVFDYVLIVVANNPNKNNYWFNENERKKIIEKSIKNLENVKVVIENIPIEDMCMKYKIFNVYRGVKAGRTIDEEIRLKNVTNYQSRIKYKKEINFIYTITSDSDFRGSSIIKKYAYDKKCIEELIPKEIINDILNRYGEINNENNN